MTSVVLAFEGLFCHATVTPGAVILVHAVVGPSSTVGHGALVNTGAFLDDESSLDGIAWRTAARDQRTRLTE